MDRTIEQLQIETGADLEDIQMLLLDNYPDPEAVTTVTEAEYEALSKSLGSQGGKISLSAASTIEEQRSQVSIVENAAQIFEASLQAQFEVDYITASSAYAARNAMLDAVQAEANKQAAEKLNQRTRERLEAGQELIAKIQEMTPSGLGSVIADQSTETQSILKQAQEMAQKNQDFLQRVSMSQS